MLVGACLLNCCSGIFAFILYLVIFWGTAALMFCQLFGECFVACIGCLLRDVSSFGAYLLEDCCSGIICHLKGYVCWGMSTINAEFGDRLRVLMMVIY